MKTFFFQLILFALLFAGNTLSAQNNALDFGGDGDYITLTPINGFPTGPVSDFTVEMWFISTATGITPGTCNGDFRRLFALGNAANSTLFEVGECNGILSVFRFTGLGGNLLQIPGSIRDNQWHCLSVVNSANLLEVFLDGNSVLTDATVLGPHNISIFQVGHGLASAGAPSPGEDWKGGIDEVKLWNTALPAAQLTACSHCVLTGSEPNLVAYWQFDQGVAGGDNITVGANPGNPITQAMDASFSGSNSGFLNPFSASPAGFDLMGPTSNFVSSGAPLVYPNYNNLSVFIFDPIQMVGIPWVCNGDGTHFAIIDQNGNVPQAAGGVTVDWFYSDDGGNNWPGILVPPPFSSFQFAVQANGATAITCPDIAGLGYVDRQFRAIITVQGQCPYTTQPATLRIFCEVTQANVQVASTPAAPLCEGDQATFNVSLTTNMPAPGSSNFVHINWCLIVGGGLPVPLPQYDDLPGFTYPASGTYLVGTQDICFKATVSNLGCASLTGQACIHVDPDPVCGYIAGLPVANPTNLTLIGIIPWPIYEICPGNDAFVGVNPTTLPPFTNCNPQWQYSFGPFPFTWINMGFSNPVQNTNILPAHFTPPWPAGQTNIYYQIECLPLSSTSNCDPCFSNIVEIRLKPPIAQPLITISSSVICNGGFATLNVQPIDPLVTQYTWYCNGAIIGWGPSITVSSQACYWVVATDGCSSATSDRICLQVCTAVAIMKCPQDNPCVIPNLPITIDGCMSYSTCGGPLTYFWTWNNGTYVSGQGTCQLVHIPDPNGTLYTLTVVDSNGCSHTAQGSIKPCQP